MVANNRKPHTSRNCLFVFGNNHSDCRTVGDSTVESGTSNAEEIRAFPTISFSNRGHVGVPIITQRISPSTSTFVHPSYLYVCVHVASQLCSYKCRRTVT